MVGGGRGEDNDSGHDETGICMGFRMGMSDSMRFHPTPIDSQRFNALAHSYFPHRRTQRSSLASPALSAVG